MDDFPQCFYQQIGENRYQATEATVGPWSPQLQHGGPPAALLAHALRTYPSDDGLQLGRLAVEIFGPVSVDQCEINVEVVRPGKRIELLRGQMRVEGRTTLLAHAWRLKPEPGLTAPVPDDFVMPAFPPEQPQKFFAGVETFPYAHAMEWRFTEGGFDDIGPATVWARPRIPLIDAQATAPLEALLLMLDSANGISTELDIRRWSFVPVDLNLGIYRQPAGTWMGMAARTVLADNGFGQTSTTVFDRDGPLGKSLHTLFVRPQ